jgi:hypothetical protein
MMQSWPCSWYKLVHPSLLDAAGELDASSENVSDQLTLLYWKRLMNVVSSVPELKKGLKVAHMFVQNKAATLPHLKPTLN